MLPVAIDVMSGDQQPREYVSGALRALHDDAQLRVLLVGDTALIDAELRPLPEAIRGRAEVVTATEVVERGLPVVCGDLQVAKGWVSAWLLADGAALGGTRAALELAGAVTAR